jgi:hypothetical protein
MLSRTATSRPRAHPDPSRETPATARLRWAVALGLWCLFCGLLSARYVAFALARS